MILLPGGRELLTPARCRGLHMKLPKVEQDLEEPAAWSPPPKAAISWCIHASGCCAHWTETLRDCLILVTKTHWESSEDKNCARNIRELGWIRREIRYN